MVFLINKFNDNSIVLAHSYKIKRQIQPCQLNVYFQLHMRTFFSAVLMVRNIGCRFNPIEEP